MQLDLTPVLNGRVRELDFDYSFELADNKELLPEYVQITAPVQVKAKILNIEGYLTVTANISAKYETQCDRCLDKLDRECKFDFERVVAFKDQGDENDDVVYVNEGRLYIDKDIAEQLSLEIPMYHMCSEDCPGLCPKCGKKLALGDCGCRDIKEIDPRLAILQKLLDKQD